jgi:HAD superfamily hydrolase (TIGR01509 family)
MIVQTSRFEPIEAVIFDMDGLLLDSETLSMEASMSAADALGYDMPRAFCHSMIGSPVDRCREMIAERYGADFPMERYVALQHEHLTVLADSGRLVLKTGVAELLDLLDGRGLKRAIATSSGRARTLHHLARVGIAERFGCIVTRDDVSRGKPDPEPFLTAAARLEVRPEACLALEDSHNGVRAAHAAGMRVIMVPDLLEATSDMHDKAHRIVDSLHDVIRFLDEAAPGATG